MVERLHQRRSTNKAQRLPHERKRWNEGDEWGTSSTDEGAATDGGFATSIASSSPAQQTFATTSSSSSAENGGGVTYPTVTSYASGTTTTQPNGNGNGNGNQGGEGAQTFSTSYYTPPTTAQATQQTGVGGTVATATQVAGQTYTTQVQQNGQITVVVVISYENAPAITTSSPASVTGFNQFSTIPTTIPSTFSSSSLPSSSLFNTSSITSSSLPISSSTSLPLTSSTISASPGSISPSPRNNATLSPGGIAGAVVGSVLGALLLLLLALFAIRRGRKQGEEDEATGMLGGGGNEADPFYGGGGGAGGSMRGVGGPGPMHRPTKEAEDEEEEDCGCGTPPQGAFSDSEDELDVLDFVLRDQELALKGTNSTSSQSTRIAGETGLGLFKRPGVEGLSLSPSADSSQREGGEGEPTMLSALTKSKLATRRPSTAPAATRDESVGVGLLAPPVPTPRTRTRTISNLIPKLRLPRAGSSDSSDESTSSENEEARDSDETVPAEADVEGTGAAKLRRKRRTKRKTEKKKSFDRFIMPSEEELKEARQCELVGETGIVVTLDELIKQRGRVVFVALRHFWCNLCQQYVQALREAMLSLVTFQNSVDSLSLATHSSVSVGEYHEPRAVIPPLYIVLVSTGSHRLIPTYRQRLDCPFPLYVDKSRKLYKTLGMTKSSLGMGKESEKGSYIRNSNWENVVNSTKNGLAMPRYPGPQAQLGGEFVFTHHPEDDSVSCEYASRMHTTRAHAEIRDLFAAAGVHLNDQDAESVYGESTYSHLS